MMRYMGKPVCGGIAVGRLSVYRKKDRAAAPAKAGDPAAELARFDKAREIAKRQLEKLGGITLREAGEAEAAIFEAHRILLDDPGFEETVSDLIRSRRVSAEYAVAAAQERIAGRFAAMEDEYMRERAADVEDVCGRVLAALSGGEEAESLAETEAGSPGTAADAAGEDPVILAADDLTPSETVRLDPSRILSFVTRYGSAHSHTAILARAMRIPALSGVDFEGDIDGHMAIVDGDAGILYVDPDGELLETYRRRQQDRESSRMVQEQKQGESVAGDGGRVKLCANIGDAGDVAAALKNGADGIGLFRTEFLYLKSDTFPTEEEQFEVYRSVAEAMGGKRVIIRTLDIGGDKRADYFCLPEEENPALGCRGIRVCLTRPEIFKTQLRAIFRAACYGNLAVMYPMIISVDEVRRIRKIVAEVQAELDRQGIPHGKTEQGIMIETPASVWMSEELAKEVDFFSIGSNDLTQYTLAIDRQNPRLDEFYDAHHPAVLRAIRTVIENGHKGGAWVGICGELGADVSLVQDFLHMGVDELSVSPPQLLSVRAAIENCDSGDA